jgi:hypothetical protein
MPEGGTAEPASAGLADRALDGREDRTKAIYVMGAGRSGSTILGVALGNCAGCFFAGELDKWLLMSGVSMHERHARERGGSAPDAGLWEQVRGEVAVPAELSGRQARRLIEHSSSLLRIDGWRRRRGLRSRYRRLSEDLYRAIAARTGAGCVIDSSHFPLRARELQALGGVDLYLVYLVRDPGSVVASWSRRGLPEPRFPMLVTNAYLWLTHTLSLLVFLRQPRARRLFVRYEDFIADPGAVVGKVLELVGSRAELPDFRALRSGRPYHGNRLIFSEVVAVERGDSPESARAPLTRWLQSPWALILPRLRPAAGSSPARGS